MNFGGSADDPVEVDVRVHALAQELVFSDEADFFRHALQELAQAFDAKRFFDVVVGALPHGFHGGFDGAVAGHDGHFRARQEFFDFAQQLDAGKAGQLQIGDDEIRRRWFRGIRARLRRSRLRRRR